MSTPGSYRGRSSDLPDDLSDTTLARAESGLPEPRLWRSRSNRVIAGVLGGLAEKFGLEALPVRLLYSVLTIFSAGLLVIPYVALWAITRAHGQPRPGPRFWGRSSNKVIAGVLGGLADRWHVPPIAIRVLYSAITVVTGGFPGALLYLVLWALMPSIDDEGEAARFREDVDR